MSERGSFRKIKWQVRKAEQIVQKYDIIAAAL